MMKKQLIASAVASALMATSGAVLASSGEAFNGKTLAMGGVGVAGSDFKNGAIHNPALVAQFGDEDDFALNLNAGLVATDEDDLIENAEDLVDVLDLLDIAPTIALKDQAVALLNEMQGSTASVVAGGYIQVALPNEYLPMTFFAGVAGQAEVLADIDNADITLINSGAPFSSADLVSEVEAIGAIVSEYGLSFAHSFNIQQQAVTFGLSPKYQNVETFSYRQTVAESVEDNFDADQYTLDDSNFNLDIGVHTEFESGWNLGAVVKNAIKNDYDTVDPNRKVTIEPQLRLGAAYKNSWFRGEIDIDANAIESLATVTDEKIQMARIGVEFDAFDWAQLRLGYRHDIEGTLEDTISAGIGLSPFGVVNLDIAGVYGDNDTYGAAIQLGLNF